MGHRFDEQEAPATMASPALLIEYMHMASSVACRFISAGYDGARVQRFAEGIAGIVACISML